MEMFVIVICVLCWTSCHSHQFVINNTSFEFKQGYISFFNRSLLDAVDLFGSTTNYDCGNYTAAKLLTHFITIDSTNSSQRKNDDWSLGNNNTLNQSIRLFPWDENPHNVNSKEAVDVNRCSFNNSCIFDTQHFLSLFANKTLTFIGDSLGLQLFQSLDTLLMDYQTASMTERKAYSLDYYYSASRYYSSFNATIKWCRDPRLEYLFLPYNMYRICGKNGLQTDYMFITIGAWYKPYFQNVRKELAYEKNIQFQMELLKYRANDARNVIKFCNRNITVIWRLQPHAGKIDVYNRAGLNVNNTYRHEDGMLWSNLSLEADWVYRYNQIILKTANKFHDQVIDHYTLSREYIKYITERYGIRAHHDSLHYCSAGCTFQLDIDFHSQQITGFIPSTKVCIGFYADYHLIDLNSFIDRNKSYFNFSREALSYLTLEDEAKVPNIDSFERLVAVRSTYFCSPGSRRFLYTLTGIGHPINFNKSSTKNDFTFEELKFNNSMFLSLLENKTLSIIGDSVGLQLFHGLEADLVSFQSFSHNGNGSLTRLPDHGFKHNHHQQDNHHHAAIRKYQKFNATIRWCRNNDLKETEKIPELMEFCVKDVLGSQYIVIGFGTWFKPYFKYHDGSNYLENIKINVKHLRYHAEYFRRMIYESNPSSTVFWRLHPHAGKFDEIERLGIDPDRTLYHPRNGKLWSNISLEAKWVPIYNEELISVANKHHDHILDWYTLSHAYLKYFESTEFHPHIDAVHWCAGGLPRAANVLLQHELMLHLKRFHTQSQLETTNELSEYYSDGSGLRINICNGLSGSLFIQKQDSRFNTTNLYNTIKSHASYYCEESVGYQLLQYEPIIRLSHPHLMDWVSKIRFDPEIFLSLVQNKSIVVLGDSLGLQLFNALQIELKPFEDMNHSDTVIGWIRYDVKSSRSNSILAVRKQYPSFNLTWCKDDMLQNVLKQHYMGHELASKYCSHKNIIHYNVTIIAIGAWYKPFFQNFPEQQNFTYNQSLIHNQKILRRYCFHTRLYLQKKAPDMKVIWRLHPHTGNIDETRSQFAHQDGLHWSNSSFEASWVNKFNAVFSFVAIHFNDSILDWYSLSHHYINHFTSSVSHKSKLGNGLMIPTHTDSLHWCAEGLPRGANVLLLATMMCMNNNTTEKSLQLIH